MSETHHLKNVFTDWDMNQCSFAQEGCEAALFVKKKKNEEKKMLYLYCEPYYGEIKGEHSVAELCNRWKICLKKKDIENFLLW